MGLQLVLRRCALPPDREKVMHGLKKVDTTILICFHELVNHLLFVYYPLDMLQLLMDAFMHSCGHFMHYILRESQLYAFKVLTKSHASSDTIDISYSITSTYLLKRYKYSNCYYEKAMETGLSDTSCTS